MFSTRWRASSQIQCETRSFVKSFPEDAPQGRRTLSDVNNLGCEEKDTKPLFSTPLYLCLVITLLRCLRCQFCKRLKMEQLVFLRACEKKDKKKKWRLCKGRHKIVHFRNGLHREEAGWQAFRQTRARKQRRIIKSITPVFWGITLAESQRHISIISWQTLGVTEPLDQLDT